MPYQTATSHIPDGRVSSTYRIALAGYATSWHEHEEFMFLLPNRGNLTVDADSCGAQRVGAGVLAVVAPGRFHKTTSSAGEHSHTAIYVEREFVSFCAKKINARLDRGDAPKFCTPSGALLGALHLHQTLHLRPTLNENAQYQIDLLDRLVASACIDCAIGESASTQQRPTSKAQLCGRIAAYLDATLADRLDIDTIALHFNMSRRHLTRTFREETGQSITEYQASQRVRQAAALLQVPGTTVLAAALHVGIDSPSYLARLFSKHGMPVPQSYKV